MTAQTQTSGQRRNPLLTFFIGALVAGIVTVGAMVATGFAKVIEAVPTPGDIAAALAPKPFLEIGPTVIESVKDLASLTTVEMVEYTVVEKGTDQGWLQWARGDSLRLMAVASIGAGVDLASLDETDFRVTESGDVTVSVPHAQLQYVDVDEEATQVLDRETGLFTKGDPQLESEARRLADTVLTQSALDEGILAKAEDNATSALTSFLLSLGYSSVTVVFSG